jgi:hypothetical protein
LAGTMKVDAQTVRKIYDAVAEEEDCSEKI